MSTQKKRRKNKKSYGNVIAALIFVVVAVVIVTAGIVISRVGGADETTASRGDSKNTDSSLESSESSSSGENEKPSVQNSVQTSEMTTEETTVKRSESGRIIVDTDKVKWNLLVVNMDREIPEGYDPETKEVVGSGYELDARVAPHYEEMYYAGKKDGVTLTPFSGHRSYERQRINYNNLTETYMSRYGISREEAAKKAATVILPPGTSEHNIGLAMDICNTYDSFADTKEYEWLTENAYKYGFILRYPKDKQDVTGIVYEPWHWRYVGVEYAKKIKDSGLCLEEYLDREGIAY